MRRALILIFCITTNALATIPVAETKQSFACDGSNTEFTYTFNGANGSDIEVWLVNDTTGNPTLLTVTTNYTVSATNNDYTSGGTVTTTSTYASGYTLWVVRKTPLTQTARLPNSPTIERMIDRVVRMVQELQDQIADCVRLPIAEVADMNLPNAVDRADKWFIFDSDGQPALSSTSGNITGGDWDLDAARFKGVPWFDVTHADFGATGDGATDDSAAFQAAIDAAAATVDSGDDGQAVVFIPNTEAGYAIGADLDLKSNVTLRGGKLIFSGTYGIKADSIHQFTLDGVTVVGSETDGQYGLYIHDSSYSFTVKNCRFHNLDNCVGVTDSWIGLFMDNVFEQIDATDAIGLILTTGVGNCPEGTAFGTVNDILIFRNLFQATAQSPQVPDALIRIGTGAIVGAGNHGKNIHINENCIEGWYTDGVVATNTKNLRIVGNWFEKLDDGIRLEGDFTYQTTIEGNGFYGNTNDSQMDPPILLAGNASYAHADLCIRDNRFDGIHTNHNFIEIDGSTAGLQGLAMTNNMGLTIARTSIANTTRIFFEDVENSRWGIGTSAPATTLQVDGGLSVSNGATSGGSIRFYEDSDAGTNYVEHKASSAVGANRTVDVTQTGFTVAVIKTIDLDDDASTDDYQFDDDAANTTEQVITLTNILPAYAELQSWQIRCFEGMADANTATVQFGTSSGGTELANEATACDDTNEVLGTAAGAGPILAATNAARSLYFSVTPSVNWSVMHSTGRWAVMLTYIDYGAAYTQKNP